MTGPRCWSKERLIKYAARGWDIYGKSNLIVKTQNDESKDHITVDMTTLAINELAQMYQPFYYHYHGYWTLLCGHINHLKWVDILSFIQNIKHVSNSVFILMLDVTNMSYPSACSGAWLPRRFKKLFIQVDPETRRRLTLIVENYHKTVNGVNKKSLSCFKSNSEIECYC